VVVKKLMVEKISDDKTPKPAWTPPKGKINLAWDMIYTEEKTIHLGRNEGLDVISPTWFQVKNAKES